MAPDGHDDDALLGRLQDSASADPSGKQFRRRYDDLREDYETLLDRVSLVEGQLGQSPANPRSVSSSLSEAISAPIRNLRDDYRVALDDLQEIVRGLDRLATGVLKAQHSPGQQPAPPPVSVEADDEAGTRTVRLEVKGGDTLAFQEQLAAMDGVRTASISAIDSERATLVVELENRP
jgi:hypothetical protein